MDHFTVDSLKQIKNEVLLKKKACRIIAISKTFQIEKIRPLLEFGHVDFGENKVQEAIDKWSNTKNEFKDIKLHMVGRLQTNKVKYAVQIFDYIHSVDSFKLAKKISEEQNKINRKIKLFIQINIDNEKQKSGILINELNDFYQSLVKELNLDVIGLMCIPSVEKKSQKAFELIKKLSDNIGTKEISMGMSSDYLTALDYDSTFIRIGTKIFGKRV
tara:strand:+ start:113 stop:760 length:648 start_codon:yes stop_codon:yes gene_type:complete